MQRKLFNATVLLSIAGLFTQTVAVVILVVRGKSPMLLAVVPISAVVVGIAYIIADQILDERLIVTPGLHWLGLDKHFIAVTKVLAITASAITSIVLILLGALLLLGITSK